MKTLAFIAALILCQAVLCQNRVVVTVDRQNGSRVLVKWYFQGLITPGGCDVYRQDKGKDEWIKISATPVIYRSDAITAQEKKTDKELEGYGVLAADPQAMKGLPLIALLVKSFGSEPLARFLGIMTTDSVTNMPKSCRYKVIRLNNGKAMQEGTSDWVSTMRFEPLAGPEGLALTERKSSVLLKWKPEPERYYAVHIYRKSGDTGQFRRITKDPVLLSKSKTTAGTEDFPEFFYEDRQQPSQVPLTYRLQGIDFFGYETKYGNERKIMLADRQPPAAVRGISYKVEGKKVRLCWRKDSVEEDLDGFRIYRTANNDTDFTALNKTIIKPGIACYEDSVSDFGQFFYSVAAVDIAGNERRSDAHFVDVYDNEPPLAPERVVIRSDTGRLVISWKSNREKDIAGYLLYKTVNRDDGATYVKITPRPVACCSFTEQMAAKISNRFFYKVVAVDQSLNRSPYSIAASAKMPDHTGPSAPFLRSAERTARGILVTWFLNPESDMWGYEVLRAKEGGTSAPEKVNRQTLQNNTASFEDVTDEAGTYFYTIVAIDSSGNRSVPSNKIRLRIPPGTREKRAPELQARYNERKNEVQLQWDGEAEGQFLGYVVYRAEGNDHFESVSGLLSRENWADRNIRTEAHYRYQVRLYDKAGQVLRSKEIKINTKSGSWKS